MGEIHENTVHNSGIHQGLFGKLFGKPLFLAFTLNLLALLICVLCFRLRYEVSDDFMIDAVLSGAFGNGYDPYLFWGNPILGYFLVLLYSLIPKISFYFILLMTLGFVSSTAVTYILFKKKINAVTVCMAVLFLVFYSDDLYVMLQFTKISAAAGIAGGLLILYGLWDAKEHKIRYIITGTVIAIFGSMIRFSTVYIYGAFLVVAFVIHAYTKAAETRTSKEMPLFTKDIIMNTLSKLVVCLALVAVMFGVEKVGGYIRNSSPDYREFSEFGVLRSSVTDVITPPYEVLEEDYQRLGYDGLDYVMINSWQFVDRDVYPDDKLSEVASIQAYYVNDQIHTFDFVINVFLNSGILDYPVAVALYLMAVLSVLLGKNRISPFVLILTAFAFFVFFIYTGRMVYRVEWGVYYCAITCLMSIFSFNDKNLFEQKKIKALGKECSISTISSVTVILILSAIRIFYTIPSGFYRDLNDETYQQLFDNTMDFSGAYLPQKLKLLSSFRTPHPDLISKLENDDEHYYYVDFSTAIQVFYYDYDPWVRPEQGLFKDDYAYFGSVAMHHPGEMYALAANGADPSNPYRSLTDENILLVDNNLMDYKLEYVRKYYCPDAEMVFVEEINGYKIWKIYDPSEYDPSVLLAGN